MRHTNATVISGRGYTFWPEVETVDLSLMNDIPTVLQVISAIRPDFQPVQAIMAREFVKQNTTATVAGFARALAGVPLLHEPHLKFKKRLPGATGLIRTGDSIQYANVILISG